MKNLTKLFSLLLVSFFFSCTPNTEEIIVGNWTFEKIEILNYDELIQKQLELGKAEIEQKIEEIKKQVELSEDETEKEVMNASLLKFQAALESLPQRAEEAKAAAIQNFNDIVGKATMSFNEDKSFERKLTEEEITTGNWKISEDKKNIEVSENTDGVIRDVKYIIEEITKEKLVLMLIEEENDMVMKMKMELKK